VYFPNYSLKKLHPNFSEFVFLQVFYAAPMRLKNNEDVHFIDYDAFA